MYLLVSEWVWLVFVDKLSTYVYVQTIVLSNLEDQDELYCTKFVITIYFHLPCEIPIYPSQKIPKCVVIVGNIWSKITFSV